MSEFDILFADDEEPHVFNSTNSGNRQRKTKNSNLLLTKSNEGVKVINQTKPAKEETNGNTPSHRPKDVYSTIQLALAGIGNGVGDKQSSSNLSSDGVSEHRGEKDTLRHLQPDFPLLFSIASHAALPTQLRAVEIQISSASGGMNKLLTLLRKKREEAIASSSNGPGDTREAKAALTVNRTLSAYDGYDDLFLSEMLGLGPHVRKGGRDNEGGMGMKYDVMPSFREKLQNLIEEMNSDEWDTVAESEDEDEDEDVEEVGNQQRCEKEEDGSIPSGEAEFMDGTNPPTPLDLSTNRSIKSGAGSLTSAEVAISSLQQIEKRLGRPVHYYGAYVVDRVGYSKYPKSDIPLIIDEIREKTKMACQNDNVKRTENTDVTSSTSNSSRSNSDGSRTRDVSDTIGSDNNNATVPMTIPSQTDFSSYIPPPPPQTSYTTSVTPLPLPLPLDLFTSADRVASLVSTRCFNCGGSGHTVHDCSLPRNDVIVKLNADLHRRFGFKRSSSSSSGSSSNNTSGGVDMTDISWRERKALEDAMEENDDSDDEDNENDRNLHDEQAIRSKDKEADEGNQRKKRKDGGEGKADSSEAHRQTEHPADKKVKRNPKKLKITGIVLEADIKDLPSLEKQPPLFYTEWNETTSIGSNENNKGRGDGFDRSTLRRGAGDGRGGTSGDDRRRTRSRSREREWERGSTKDQDRERDSARNREREREREREVQRASERHMQPNIRQGNNVTPGNIDSSALPPPPLPAFPLDASSYNQGYSYNTYGGQQPPLPASVLSSSQGYWGSAGRGYDGDYGYTYASEMNAYDTQLMQQQYQQYYGNMYGNQGYGYISNAYLPNTMAGEGHNLGYSPPPPPPPPSNETRSVYPTQNLYR